MTDEGLTRYYKSIFNQMGNDKDTTVTWQLHFKTHIDLQHES